MRNVRFHLIGTFLLIIGFTTSWGEAAPSSAPDSSGQTVYFPLMMKPTEGLRVSQVRVLQGSSLSGGYAVYLADRETLVRVFVDTADGKSVSEVTGRLCGYDALGQTLGCMPADNGTIMAPSTEEALQSTLNFHLPIAWTKPGFNYHVDMDPADLDPNTASGSARFPSSGKQAIDFVEAPKLDVVVVPVEYRPSENSQTFIPVTDDLSYLTYLPIKLFPVPAVDYQTHALYTYVPSSSSKNLDRVDGWVNLLEDITALHNMENSSGSKHFYGLVNLYEAHGCNGGCITGIGWLGGIGAHKTAVGWSGFGAGNAAASETMVHEMGHNFNRKHVACSGKETNIDEDYPYPNGVIGQFGVDVSGGKLYQPDDYSDYMSYCDPTWTSDYTYWNIYHYRRNTATTVQLNSEAVEASYISGIIAPDGAVTLQPVYSQRTPVPAIGSGSFTLQLLDVDGRESSVYSFNPYEIADSGGYRGFGLFVPSVEDLGGLRVFHDDQILAERYAQDIVERLDVKESSLAIDRSAAALQLDWSLESEQVLAYRLRFSQDGGKTWQVLALDWRDSEFRLPLELNRGLLEIQATDGLNTSTKVITID